MERIRKNKTFLGKILFILIIIVFVLSATKASAQYVYFYSWGKIGNALSGEGFTKSAYFNTEAECNTSRTEFKKKADKDTYVNDCRGDFVTATPTPVGVDAQNGDTGDTNTYKLLAPIDGLDQLNTSNGIGEYLGVIFKIAIGICGALAVIMIVIGGIQYMGQESIFGKTEAKGRIMSAILGLLIALGAYAILNTLNPDLTGTNGVTVDTVENQLAYPTISNSEYQNITGQPVLPKSEYVALAKKVAGEVKVDECLVIATVSAESGWRANSLGSDANFALNIPSRRAFINSGVKYSGATFTKGDASLIANKSFKDDFVVDKSKTGLGIDWRFSAGFGILGINFFPAGYFNTGWDKNPPPLSQKDSVPVIDSKYPNNPNTGNKYTPIEVMIPENSLRLGAIVLRDKMTKCNNDPYLALRAFNTGSCTKTAHNEAFRITEYKKCKGIK